MALSGRKQSPDVIEKRRQVLKTITITEETRRKMAAKLRGRPLPDWQKKILSQAAIGKKVPWSYTEIVEVNDFGVVVKHFESIAAACREYKLKSSNIIKVINGERSHTGGKKFKYK